VRLDQAFESGAGQGGLARSSAARARGTEQRQLAEQRPRKSRRSPATDPLRQIDPSAQYIKCLTLLAGIEHDSP
jgi:hypothetical protein